MVIHHVLLSRLLLFLDNQSAPAADYLEIFVVIFVLILFALLALEKLADTERLPGQTWVEGEEHLLYLPACLLSRLFIFC